MKPVVPDASLRVRDVVTHFLAREVKSIAYNEPLVHEGFDTEGVHQLRVSARRLRSEIQALRSVLPREPWRDLEDDLQWMGERLGRLRDLDVLDDLFAGHLDEGAPPRETVMSELERRRARRRREVMTMLDSRRYGQIVERLSRLSDHPHLGPVGKAPVAQMFLPALWQASCTYLDAVGDPYLRRSDVALHRVRIASKKCRYNFEVATLFLGDGVPEVAQALEAIQDVLGEVHDRSVAVSFLDTLGLDEQVDLALRRALREEIAQLRPAWVMHFLDARQAILGVFAPD